MRCPICGTEWKYKSTGGEIAAMCILSILFFPFGLISLVLLSNKKYCRCCHHNMLRVVNGNDKYPKSMKDVYKEHKKGLAPTNKKEEDK